MFTFSSVKVKALSFAAAIAVAGSSMAQAPKNKPLTGSGNGKSANSGSGQSLIKPPALGQLGGGTKPTTTTDPKAPKGSSGHSVLDPFLPLGPGQIHNPKGPKGGVVTDPVTPPKGGNDTVPPKHVPPTIDPGIGNGNPPKPWTCKPDQGKPHTVYCKTHCDPQYCTKYGVKKSFGYCYQGYNHSHWYCNRWSSVHNCWFHFDQGCGAWFYFCEPDACYYPVTHLPYKTFVSTTTVSTNVGSAAVNLAAPMQLPPLPGE